MAIPVNSLLWDKDIEEIEARLKEIQDLPYMKKFAADNLQQLIYRDVPKLIEEAKFQRTKVEQELKTKKKRKQ